MLKVTAIPALKSNYIYMLEDSEANLRAIIDPGDAEAVIDVVGDQKIDYIFITHHHWDHTDGIATLVNKYAPKVYGAEADKHRLPKCDRYLNEGDKVTFGTHKFNIIFTPGHTLGHICYHSSTDNIIFCGDTLFLGGCGRMFEGTADMYFNSLNKLKALPENTLIYCTHEYTIPNYSFLKKHAPEHLDIKEYAEKMRSIYRQKGITVPQPLKEELKHNLFLQVESAEAFAKLRKLKDNS